MPQSISYNRWVRTWVADGDFPPCPSCNGTGEVGDYVECVVCDGFGDIDTAQLGPGEEYLIWSRMRYRKEVDADLKKLASCTGKDLDEVRSAYGF